MKKALLVLAATLALGMSVGVGVARADGYIGSVKARFYSSDVHFRIGYSVFDANCVQDQYGGYSNPNCYDFADNDATVGVQIYRTGGRVWTRYGWRRPRWKHVYGEAFDGTNGIATDDIYTFELGAPYYAKRGTRLNYKAVFTLIDPNDNVVDHSSYRFYWSYG